MTTETLPEDGGAEKDPPVDGGAESMDAKRQHERFRALVKPLVEMRWRCDPTFAKHDWVVQCYNSQETMESYFPDREVLEETLNHLAVRMRAIEERVATETERIRREGLSYLDIEQLRQDSFGEQV